MMAREMGRAIGQHLRERRGQALDGLLVIVFLVFMGLMLVMMLVTTGWVFAARQHVVYSLQQTLQQAVQASIAAPDLAQGQAVLNPQTAETTFNQEFPGIVKWPANAYQITAFTVYTQSQAGQPLPVGLNGTIPGASIYVAANFELQVVPFWDPGGKLTVTIPVQMVVAPNRFNRPGHTWVGG